MRLIWYPDAAAFLRAVEPELLAREAEHALLLGAAGALARDPAATTDREGDGEGDARPHFASVHDDSRLLLAAMLAGARPLALACEHPDVGHAVALLAAGLAGRGARIAAVHARLGDAARFARSWEEVTGAALAPAMRQRLYAIDAVHPLPVVPGSLRRAEPADLALIAEWKVAFEREALGDGAVDAERVRGAAARRLAAGEPWLWVDGAPRAMAATARPTRRTIAVNAVYTPPEHRRRGYATACVAALSGRLLAGGWRQCVLFTDLANPTSNAIYERIGYRAVQDFELWRVGR